MMPTDVLSATKLVLPGVGAFDMAMSLLEGSGMREALIRRVTEDGVPILGDLRRYADPRGAQRRGLAGRARVDQGNCPLDRIAVRPRRDWTFPTWDGTASASGAGEQLAAGLSDPAEFYFLHSYYFDCARQQDVTAQVHYGTTFPCAVRRGNVHGVQFHPEKSHHNGVTILKNFAEL